MRRRTLRSAVVGASRLLVLVGAGAIAASCHEPLDTGRRAPPKATLGDDVYGVLCDRVAASSLNEDLEGVSYQRVCHPYFDGEAFRYDDKVDESRLAPIRDVEPNEEDESERARRLGIAKVEAMARWRGALIVAINASVGDEKGTGKVEIDNIAPGEGGKIRLNDALLSLSQTMTPLYELNPFDPSGEPVMPASTRALGRLFDAFVGSEAAVLELSKIWGRQGYRPAPISLGAVRAALEYTDLREMTRAQLDVLGPGGAGAEALQALLLAGKKELQAFEPSTSNQEPFDIDDAIGQPNRPRTVIELAGAVALAQHDSFAATDDAPRSLIARRDRRGFVRPKDGAMGPFVDLNADALPDVDDFGRFVDGSGAPLDVPPPFAIPGVTAQLPANLLDPLAEDLYSYLDTSRTVIGAVLRSVSPLVDGTKYAGDGDPEPWKSEHEGLMYALAGSYLLYGDREDAKFDYVKDAVIPATTACSPAQEGKPDCLTYRRFRGEDSPLADLAHAVGQVLADKDSDAFLLGLIDLLENPEHQDVLPRLVGAALRVRDISRDHDRLAEQGLEPLAKIPYETPIWDEMAEVVAEIVEQPGLLTRLLDAFASDAALTPHGSSRHMGDTLAVMMKNRDMLTYDSENVNGTAVNLTVGGSSVDDPRTPVDLTKPKASDNDGFDNRSCLERSLHLIHDTQGATQCNKEGAVVSVFGLQIPFVDFDECELFQINNLAAYYLDALLPDGHVKKTRLYIKPDLLRPLVSDFVLRSASGLDELSTTPSAKALGRLVFFGADSTNYAMSDLDLLRDTTNATINRFITETMEPGGTNICPKNANGVNTCTNPEDLMRIRVPNTLFLMERIGFGEYLSPIVGAFAMVDTSGVPDNPSYKGEELLIKLLTIAYRHWPGPDHGPECNSDGSAGTNPKYCSGAGGNTYEPLIADAAQADDVIASSVELARAVNSSRITVQRGTQAGQTWTGAQVIERMARVLFSTKYAASVNMVDRRGNKAATWVDGRTQPQLSVFNLVADALHSIDLRFDQSSAPDAKERKSQWKRAQDELIDTLLRVEGTGSDTRFKNRALPQIAVAALKAVREQLNAHCPNREQIGGECAWAREELGPKVVDLLSHPLFGALMDVQEALRKDESARRETERFLTYMLDVASDEAAFHALLATASDALQVLANDDVLTPLLRAAATALSPSDDRDGPGAADTGLKALKALNDDRYDKYHAMDHVLPGLVRPLPDGRAPIQIFLDAIADVNRVDASSTEPLDDEDYRQMFLTAREFMIDETRGLEQFYAILRNRPHE